MARLDDFGDHAVLRIPSFDDPKFEDEAVRLIEHNREVPNLIIDVRGNGGGDTPVALLAALMDRDYPGWIEATPLKIGLETAENAQQGAKPTLASRTPRTSLCWSTAWTAPRDDAYRGGLVILVDIESKSATEDFLMPLQYTRRAILVGETTAGSSGQPYVECVGPHLCFTIGAKRQLFPDGRRFEGVGILPDHFVDPRSAARSKTDLALETALRLLSPRPR